MSVLGRHTVSKLLLITFQLDARATCRKNAQSPLEIWAQSCDTTIKKMFLSARCTSNTIGQLVVSDTCQLKFPMMIPANLNMGMLWKQSMAGNHQHDPKQFHKPKIGDAFWHWVYCIVGYHSQLLTIIIHD